MTPEQTANLTNLIMLRRNALHLSVNEVARLTNIDPATIWRLEQGLIASPRMDRLIAIAAVLGVSPVELFITVGWISADDMPPLGTYLQKKFAPLPDAVVRHIEYHVDKILHAYSHSAGHRHNTADAQACPWCTDHSVPHPNPPQEPR